MAPYLVLGEAPGKIEDRLGEPFVGPAGRFLKVRLSQLGMLDNAVFANTVSCFPVADEFHKPTTEQVRACRGNLKAQLDVVPGPYVLACGAYAIKALIRHVEAVKHVMGAMIPIHGKRVYPIYHPSFILRANDPVLERKWMDELWRFGEMMAWGTESSWHNCIYCGKVTHSEHEPTCWAHRRDWRNDQNWNPSRQKKRKIHPDQGSLL